MNNINDEEYYYIDNNDYFISKQKKIKSVYSEFDKLLKEKNMFYRKFLYKGYIISKGNISLMARGLHIERNTLYRYLKKVFGINFRNILRTYKFNSFIKGNKNWE